MNNLKAASKVYRLASISTLLVIVITMVASCHSRKSFLYRSAQLKYIKLFDDRDSLLIAYSGKKKITYCQALKYMANTSADTLLFHYFHANSNRNINRFVRTMNYKTYICPRWTIDFAGPIYPSRRVFYGDIYKWMLYCDCVYADSTLSEVMMRAD